MKIIFKDEHEMQNFLTVVSNEFCPREFGYSNRQPDYCSSEKEGNRPCMSCWLGCGIEMVIESVTPLISREKILEKRCERYREIIRTYVRVEEFIDELYKVGKLSLNDAKYLMDLEEINTSDELAAKKPPLGVMPRYLWERKRRYEVGKAISRYVEADKKIPIEWLDEYNELVQKAIGDANE